MTLNNKSNLLKRAFGIIAIVVIVCYISKEMRRWKEYNHKSLEAIEQKYNLLFSG
jgi:hypothetical protein